MVDLRESLRPTGTVPPLPVAELAARAKARRRRRRAAGSGVLVGLIGVAAIAVTMIPRTGTDTQTVADGAVVTTQPTAEDGDQSPAEPSNSTPTADESPADDASPLPSVSGEAAGTAAGEEPPASETPTVPEPAAADEGAPSDQDGPAPVPSATPGIRTTTTTTSSWEDGYCIQIDLANELDSEVDWQVVLDLEGAIAELWNATAAPNDGLVVFTGKAGYNTTLAAGASTSFGTCVDRDPTQEQP